MKKVLIAIIGAVLILSLAACAPQDGISAGASASGIFAVGSSPANSSAVSTGTLAVSSAKETQAGSEQTQRIQEDTSGKIDLKGKLEFNGQTVDGKPVNSSVFKDYKLTMINIWGTLCKPCIEEMPDIETLYQDMKGEQVNVIGFVANVLGGEDASKITEVQRAADAKKILDAKGVTYTNIVFDDTGTDQINRQISGFPTTIFVDGQGKVIGSQISGPKSKDGYKTEIANRLKETSR
jgi:thiol-disulfide isomerase/thioredoxin